MCIARRGLPKTDPGAGVCYLQAIAKLLKFLNFQLVTTWSENPLETRVALQ